MNISPEIPEAAFSSWFALLKIAGATSDVLFTLKRYTSGQNPETILSETYTPDIGGNISIFDLQPIIEAAMGVNFLTQFIFIFDPIVEDVEEDEQEFGPVTVFRSRAEIEGSADKFANNSFLSLLTGDKIIRSDSYEYLSAYIGSSTEDVSAVSRHREADGSYSQHLHQAVIQLSPGLHTLDVSPSNYQLVGKTLVSYIVIIGIRFQNYVIDPVSHSSPLRIRFMNNFGMPETFDLPGNVESENKYDNTTGNFGGEFRKIRSKLTREYKAYTGILTQEMAVWLEDLFMSDEVHIMHGDELWKRIVITEAEVKRSTGTDEMPSFNFKYRLAQNNQDIVPAPAERIFDEPFDYQFN